MAISTTQAAGPASVRRLLAASWAAGAAWGITAASLIATIVISIMAKTDRSDPFSYIVAPVAVMGFASVGTLIVSRRQGNGRTGRGTGLQGMADRLEVLGGRLELTSAPGKGTTVVGWIPVNQGDRG